MSARPRILFVDDEPAVLSGLRNALRSRRSHWDMEFANGGAEAIAVIEREQLTVIVSDLRMPGIDGADVLRRASEVQPSATRILLTGFGDREALARVLPWTQLLLSKPLGARDIAAAVSRACDLRALLDDPDAAALSERFGTRAPPSTFATLAALRFEDRIDVDVVAGAIDRDPTIARHVLALARSPAFGRAAPPRTSHELAARIDLDALAPLALLAHVLAMLADDACTSEQLDLAMSHAVAMGIATRDAHADTSLAYEAFAAGLLHDVGKLVADSRHAEAGARLFARCGLPLVVLETIAYHGNSITTPGTLHAALREAHEIAAVSDTRYPSASRT